MCIGSTLRMRRPVWQRSTQSWQRPKFWRWPAKSTGPSIQAEKIVYILWWWLNTVTFILNYPWPSGGFLRWKSHPDRVSSMKNMTKSELSRRRLVRKPPSPLGKPEASSSAPEVNDDDPDNSGGMSDKPDSDSDAEWIFCLTRRIPSPFWFKRRKRRKSNSTWNLVSRGSTPICLMSWWLRSSTLMGNWVFFAVSLEWPWPWWKWENSCIQCMPTSKFISQQLEPDYSRGIFTIAPKFWKSQMPGEISRTIVCQWTSEDNMVVLEVPDDNEASKATSDSDKCTWSELLREMEDSEVHDPTINSHELLAPMTDGGKEPSKIIATCNTNKIMIWSWIEEWVLKGWGSNWGDQRYIIKPKPTPIYFNFSAVTTGHKYTNCASAFTVEDHSIPGAIPQR